MRKLMIAVSMLGILSTADAQNGLLKKITGEKGLSKNYISLTEQEQLPFSPEKAGLIIGLPPQSDLQLINTETDQLGITHYRYKETFKGIPVENSMLLTHVKGGKLTGMGGGIILDFTGGTARTTVAALSGKNAIDAALNYVHAKKYAWQDANFEQRIKLRNGNAATYYPVAEKVWFAGEDQLNPAQLTLAYKIDVYSLQPLDRKFIYIDARTGKILGTRQELMHSDATGTAATGYSGTQTIHSDLNGSSYRLRDLTKGNGIITLHAASGHADYTNTSANWALTGADKWALDAHFGVAATWTFYKNNFNRNSVDNAGYALTSWVNDAANTDNADWDGSEMDYGNLSSNGNGVTAIDVTGHELTHGVTQYTCNLVYSKEPGAMNESMSDIMGKSVQFYTKPTDNSWILSNDMAWEIRSFANPKADGQPNTYKGTYWVTSSSDNYGVHTNSGVGNYMYYLLVMGGSGTNDLGNAYTVSGIGLSEAQQILYRTETVYLTSTSQYADWRTACVNAATDLYGAGSNEVIQVQNAWYAVGIGAAGGTACTAPTGLAVSSITNSGANFSWTAVVGSTGYTVQYRPVGTVTWSTATAATNSLAVTGLVAGTNYEVQVRNNCSATSSSAYTASVTFTTTGTAPCNTPVGMATSSITGTTAVISWTAALNAASYNVQYRVVGAASWSTANTTTASYTITGLSINTNYEWQVQTACTGGGTSSFTSSTTFTTTGLTYCTSVGQTLDGITNVTFNTINNTTSGTSAGYTDYTATQSTTVSTGNAYTLSVKLNTGGNYTNYAKAWIDWNHDGVFSTTTEEYNLGTAVNVTSGATTLSPLSITVPAGAVIGTTRMRVSTQYNAAPSPCTASFDGEVEDYSVIVVAGSGCNAPSGLSTSAISTTGATLGWTAVSGATGYTLQWKLSTATTWTTITGLTTNSYALTGLTAGTAYQFQVSTVCSATSSSAYSSPVSFTTTAAAVCTVPGGLAASAITNTGATLGWSAVSGATGYTLQWKLSTATTWTTITGLTTNSYALTGLTLGTAYQFQVSTVCSSTSSSAYSSPVSFTTTGGTVTYCASHGTTTYEYIKTVALGTINHTVANDGGYGNYTSVSTALTAGTAYTIKLTPGFASGSYTEYWTVYIDYNQDGTLNGTGEVVASGSGTGTGAKSLTFTVPATAKNGATRIRVQMNYGSSSTNPCATLTYGDVHDYTVTISGGTGLQPAGFAAAGQPIHPTADITVYPNPVNTATATVNYSIPSEGSVSMNLVDMYGRVLQSINLGNQSEGAHHYWLNTLDQLKSGHYFIVLYHNNLLAGRNRVVVVHP